MPLVGYLKQRCEMTILTEIDYSVYRLHAFFVEADWTFFFSAFACIHLSNL